MSKANPEYKVFPGYSPLADFTPNNVYVVKYRTWDGGKWLYVEGLEPFSTREQAQAEADRRNSQ